MAFPPCSILTCLHVDLLCSLWQIKYSRKYWNEHHEGTRKICKHDSPFFSFLLSVWLTNNNLRNGVFVLSSITNKRLDDHSLSWPRSDVYGFYVLSIVLVVKSATSYNVFCKFVNSLLNIQVLWWLIAVTGSSLVLSNDIRTKIKVI